MKKEDPIKSEKKFVKATYGAVSSNPPPKPKLPKPPNTKEKS